MSTQVEKWERVIRAAIGAPYISQMTALIHAHTNDDAASDAKEFTDAFERVMDRLIALKSMSTWRDEFEKCEKDWEALKEITEKECKKLGIDNSKMTVYEAVGVSIPAYIVVRGTAMYVAYGMAARGLVGEKLFTELWQEKSSDYTPKEAFCKALPLVVHALRDGSGRDRRFAFALFAALLISETGKAAKQAVEEMRLKEAAKELEKIKNVVSALFGSGGVLALVQSDSGDDDEKRAGHA